MCVTKAKDWEKKLDNLSRLWRVLHQKQHKLEEWLDQAQAALEDTEDDYESLIRKHKGFFVRVDERMLQDYLHACQDILVVLEEEDRPALTESMENIQQRWEVRLLFCLCSPDEHLTYLMPRPLLGFYGFLSFSAFFFSRMSFPFGTKPVILDIYLCIHFIYIILIWLCVVKMRIV